MDPHSDLTAIFPGDRGLAGCLFSSPFIRELCVLLRQVLLTFHVILNTIPPGFFGRTLCLIPSTSHVVQHLTQSLSSFRSTCPNRRNLLFLINNKNKNRIVMKMSRVTLANTYGNSDLRNTGCC